MDGFLIQVAAGAAAELLAAALLGLVRWWRRNSPADRRAY